MIVLLQKWWPEQDSGWTCKRLQAGIPPCTSPVLQWHNCQLDSWVWQEEPVLQAYMCMQSSSSMVQILCCKPVTLEVNQAELVPTQRALPGAARLFLRLPNLPYFWTQKTTISCWHVTNGMKWGSNNCRAFSKFCVRNFNTFYSKLPKFLIWLQHVTILTSVPIED